MIYRLYKTNPFQSTIDAAMTVNSSPAKSFLFDPANTDYQQFKKDIMAGGELQDADGAVMTPEAAQEFVKGLP